MPRTRKITIYLVSANWTLNICQSIFC